jgi:hypothetical protein
MRLATELTDMSSVKWTHLFASIFAAGKRETDLCPVRRAKVPPIASLSILPLSAHAGLAAIVASFAATLAATITATLAAAIAAAIAATIVTAISTTPTHATFGPGFNAAVTWVV